MNKKLFLGMFAATGMLLATSCSNDELGVVQSGNEAQVSFSLGLEGGIDSRAISDGKSADVLMYAVFDKDGNRINTIDKVSKTGVTFPTTENITLAKGQTYKVAFWAQDEDCKAYTVSDDMKVTVDYQTNNTSNNDETRDAFFKTIEFTVTGSTSINVELKRPFAQINVGVTKADWDAAVASGITVENSSVVIKNAATNLNLIDGTVYGDTEVSYSLAEIPSNPAILKVDTDGNGTDEEYQWLSMSYILPADYTTGYAKTTLDNVAFVFESDGEPIKFNQGLNSVPVQRNWRTNIVGKLLTGDITFNIVIDEKFEDDHNLMYTDIFNVTDVTELQYALNNATDGALICFANDITGDVIATQKPNVKISVSGQGYKLNGMITVDGKSATYTTAGLTIKDVNFAAQSINGDACIRLGNGNNATRYTCNVTVDNCTFDVPGAVGVKSYTGGDKNLTITGSTATVNAHSLVQVAGVDNVLVEGCTINSVRGMNFNSSTNVIVDNCSVDVQKYAVRYGAGSSASGAGEGKVYSIKNSTLKSANEEGDAAIVLRGTADNSILNIDNTTIEANKKIQNDAINAKVLIDGVVTVSSTNALASAISEGVAKIELSAGTYTIPVEAKNKTLTISGTEDVKIDITRGLTYVNGADITFEGVTIQSKPEGAGYTNGFADLKNATFNNCVINGTIGLDFTCEFNNCEFNIEGNYYNVWTWGAGIATFSKCTFNCDGKALLVYANVLDNGSYHQTVNITECIFNDNGDNTVTGKAAIEITNTYTPIRTYDVIIKNTTVNGFAQTVPGSGDFNANYGSVESGNIGTNVWGNKCKLSNEYLNVVIDNVDVY